MRSTSDEPKRTAAFHLPVWLLDSIERLAVLRGTNKSHELTKAAKRGLQDDPTAGLAAVADDAAPLARTGD